MVVSERREGLNVSAWDLLSPTSRMGPVLALPRSIVVFKMITSLWPCFFVFFMYKVFPKVVIQLNMLVITGKLGLYYILPC